MQNKILTKRRFRNLYFLFTTVLFCLIFDQRCLASKGSRIVVRENGYENILIGIEEQVQEDIQLLDNLKEAFTQASNFLFSITKKRVFFREIIILVPNSWTTEVYYDNSVIKSADSRIKNSTWESLEKADILIENWDSSSNEVPFVVNFGSECGEQGDGIIFSSKFFLDIDRSNTLFGSMTNLIVNLWSQFRYGIHPEYPAQNDEGKNEFYLNENGEIEPTRCSANIRGKIRNKFTNSECKNFLANGLPASDCTFEEETNSSSLMLIPPSLIKLTEFCDNETENMDLVHNRLAPTLQNILCGSRSIWEVLRSHPDFSNFKNMPLNNFEKLEPKFHVVKSKLKKTVILIDRSIHYLHQRDYINLKNALIDYIRLMINDDIEIGIVHFDRSARIVWRMMPAKSLKERVDLFDIIIPKKGVASNSNIWNGLSLSLLMLESTHQHILPTGGRIVLITNSLSDPSHPNINNIINETKKNGIIIDMITYGSKKDEKIEDLIKETNGINFKVLSYWTDIWSSLSVIANRDKSNLGKNIELTNKVYNSDEKKSPSHFYIDSSIAKKNSVLKIFLNFQDINEKVDLSIFDPRGVQYDTGLTLQCIKSNFDDLKDQQDLVCEFSKPKQGKWTIRINTPRNGNYKLKIVAMVYFGIHEKHKKPKLGYYYFDDKNKRNTLGDITGNVKIEARWAKMILDKEYTQSIYLALSLENKPILNAKIIATIYRPTGDSVKIQLYDNGLNSDKLKDDGIYSRYFSEFNSNGIYSGKVEILTEKESKICHHKTLSTILLMNHINSVYSKNDNNSERYCSSVSNIHRVVNLGSFELKNYINDKDIIPPSKIKDLKVLNIDFRNEFVQFGFTAPGNNHDKGRCFKYKIRICKNASLLLSNKNLTNDKLFPVEIIESSFREIPNLSGFMENFYLSFKNIQAKVIAVQIRALDEHQNHGEWSNVVNIKLSNEITFSSRIKLVPKSMIEIKHSDSLQDIKERQHFYSSIFIIISAFLLLIFMVQIILTILLLVQKFKKKKCFHDYKPIRV